VDVTKQRVHNSSFIADCRFFGWSILFRLSILNAEAALTPGRFFNRQSEIGNRQ
jgi:hypothetical protein